MSERRKRASAIYDNKDESLDVIAARIKSSRGVKRDKEETFQGIEICKWLVQCHYADNMDRAIEIANVLMKRGVFSSLDENVTSVRFDESRFIMNQENTSSNESTSKNEIHLGSQNQKTKSTTQSKRSRFDRFLSTLSVIDPERRDVGAIVIIVSYTCGCLNLGFTSMILLFVGWCFFVGVHNHISESHQRKIILENALEADIGDFKSELALIRLSPPWYRNADIERSRWFNLFLKQMWKNGLSRSIDETVTELLDWKLEELRPSFIRSFKTKHCDFTTLRPYVHGVKVHRQSETNDDKSTMIDLDVEILSQDPKALVVSARLLTGPVHVAAGNIVLKGKLRLQFCEPMDYFMPYQLLNISFVTMPELDFSLCALTKGFDFNKIGGVRQKISSLVNESLTDLMVWYVWNKCHSFFFFITKHHTNSSDTLHIVSSFSRPNVYPYEMFDPIFEAKLQVAVLKVHMKESHNSTFVKLSCAGYEKKTSTKSSKYSPEFNQEFDFTVTDPKTNLRIEMWSKGSMFTGNRMLGFKEFAPLEQSRENTIDNQWYTLLHPKREEKDTNIQISLKLRWFQTSKEKEEIAVNDLPTNSKSPSSSVSTKINEEEFSQHNDTTTPTSSKISHRSTIGRKLSLLLDHKEEGDVVFDAYKTATRGCIFLPSKFEGQAMYTFLFKYCGLTESHEAMELCNRLLSSGLIWDSSYLRFKKGKYVRILEKNSTKESDGVITAIGSEDTKKVFVVTTRTKEKNSKNDNAYHEITCPIHLLRPYVVEREGEEEVEDCAALSLFCSQF